VKGLHTHIFILFLTFCLLIVTSCSVDKFIPEGRHMLTSVAVTCDDKDVMKAYALGDYVTQQTNSKWFGAKVPLGIYTLSGTDTTKRSCRFWRKLGEAPVLYDSVKSRKAITDIIQVLGNAGYMKATVDEHKTTKGKKVQVLYHVHPNQRYYIRQLHRIVEDSGLRSFIMEEDTARSLLRQGAPFEVTTLNAERNRIATYLRNNGYYKFTKDDIRFSADTARNSTEVDVLMSVKMQQDNGRTQATPHRRYTMGNVNFLTDLTSSDTPIDSTYYQGYNFFSQGRPHFRKRLLISHSFIRPKEYFNDSQFRRTYTSFTRLGAIAFSNINLTERPGTDTLDCNITVNHAKPHSFGFDVEATNSAGDFGAAISTSYQNRNLFRGSESFTFKVRGAYEAITGLEGYEGNNYFEVGTETSLRFPTFIFPFVKREWGTEHNASSEIMLQHNIQSRPEFVRRVMTAAWRYRWNNLSQRVQHRYDLLEVNYIYMPWISRTFREQYLDSLGKTNAILKYNYENLLITKMGYTYSYNSLGAREQTYGKNAHTIRFNIETSGNVLSALTHIANGKKNKDNQYTFCGSAYAQYVKGDFDFTKSIQIGTNSSIALHSGFGIAYPYGNSDQLPFEKRYFSGGANSLRGWSVRSLGPGAYNGKDRGINFLNQCGDIKLDLSLEYRAKLFWKFSGAVFVDAGNIWTIREYKDQPGGEFRFGTFVEQIAASYGLGLRMDANFFIVRFDAGMKAIDPAYRGRDHYPITHHDYDRDFAFHFAVGMPF